MDTSTADLINGGFEMVSFLFVLNHCRVLLRDKQVKGVSIVSTAFFNIWGYWNLVYYNLLDQTLSFYGCILTVAANSLWVYLMIWYSVKPVRERRKA